MPVLEGFQVSAETKALAFQGHVQRCQDRIATWQKKLANSETTDAERDVILEDLAVLERQLTEPFTRRTLEQTPLKAAAPPEAPNPLMALVLSLKEQLESMKAQLKGPHEILPVPKSEAASER